MRHAAHHITAVVTFQRGGARRSPNPARAPFACRPGWPFPGAALALLGGAWLGLQSAAGAPPIALPAAGAGLILALAARRIRPRRGRHAGLWMALALLAMLRADCRVRHGREGMAALLARGRGGELMLAGRTFYLWDRDAWGFQALCVYAAAGWETLPRPVRLRLADRLGRPAQWPIGEWAGATVELTGRVRAHPEARNPGEPPPARAWRCRGIDGVLEMSRHGLPLVRRAPAPPVRWAAAARAAARQRLHQTAVRWGAQAPESMALWLALLLGDQEQLATGQRWQFEATGTLHLFAVSGLHVGLVAAISGRLARASWRRLGRQGGRLLGIAVAGAYTLVTGGPPSAVRAFWMYVVWVGAEPLRRASDARAAAAWTIAGFALLRPELLRDPGLQLSFSVVAGLVLWAPRLLAAAPLWGAPDPWKPRQLWSRADRFRSQAARYVRGLCVTSAAAFAAALPWSGILFGRLAPASLALNVVAIPLAGWALAVGAAAHLADGIGGELAAPLFLALWRILDMLRAAVAVVACDLRHDILVPARGWDTSALVTAALCWGVGPLGLGRTSHPWRWWACMLAGASGLLAWAPAPPPPAAALFDAGPGPCLAVRGEEGGLLLVNSGSRSFGRRVLRGYLRRWPVAPAEITAVATANRLDHLGGFLELAPWFDGARLSVLATGGRSQAVRLLRVAAGWREGEEASRDKDPAGPQLASDGAGGWLVAATGWTWWLAGVIPAELPGPVRRAPGRLVLVLTAPVTASARPVAPPPPAGATCVLLVDPFRGGAGPEHLEWQLARRGWRVYRTDRDGAVVVDAEGRLRPWLAAPGGCHEPRSWSVRPE